MFKLTLSFKGKVLKVCRIAGDQASIGRSSDCDIQIDNLGVSAMHARIAASTGKTLLIDTSEDIGLFVNGIKVTEHELVDGDVILVGKHTITFAHDVEPSHGQSKPVTHHGPVRGGWLQFLNGPKLGRTIRLDRNLIRLGKNGHNSAMIASRNDGYYISHLEGETRSQVGSTPVGDESLKLRSGDTIKVGEIEMLFFMDEN